MTYETIRFDVAEAVATLTLHRPDKLNSFTLEMHEELRDVMNILKGNQSIRALLITGAGRGFCAGQDLSARQIDLQAGTVDTGAGLDKNFNPLIRALRSLSIPIVCAVNGVAAGAGANFALSCDIVFAAESASFIQAFVKIGLIPDCGGSFYLPRLVGDARARALSMLGEKITAQEAAQWGMIWKCVPDAELLPLARASAEKLAKSPTVALGLIKRLLNASSSNTLDAQLDLERDLQRLAGQTQDFREGVTAFMEKREANFRGG